MADFGNRLTNESEAAKSDIHVAEEEVTSTGRTIAVRPLRLVIFLLAVLALLAALASVIGIYAAEHWAERYFEKAGIGVQDIETGIFDGAYQGYKRDDASRAFSVLENTRYVVDGRALTIGMGENAKKVYISMVDESGFTIKRGDGMDRFELQRDGCLFMDAAASDGFQVLLIPERILEEDITVWDQKLKELLAHYEEGYIDVSFLEDKALREYKAEPRGSAPSNISVNIENFVEKRLYSDDGRTEPPETCAEVHYPEISIGGTGHVVLKNAIEKLNQECSERAAMSLDDLGETAAMTVRDDFDGTLPIMTYYDYIDAEVVRVDERVVSIRCAEEYYGGGAHSNWTYHSISIDAQTGARLELSDVLLERDLDKVAAVIAKELGYDSDAPSTGHIQLRRNIRRSLGDGGASFALGSEGIVFYFGSYSIDGFVPTEAEIKYEDYPWLIQPIWWNYEE